MNSIESIGNLIPIYGEKICNLPIEIKNKATDIKFSLNNVPKIYTGAKFYRLENCEKMTPLMMEDLFYLMCENSVYKHLDEIKNGYISLANKYRVGICGTAITNNGVIENIKNINSMTIRIPRNINDVSNEIYDIINKENSGVLIVGEPSSGKTTILKDLIRKLHNSRMVVLDERFELSDYDNSDVLYSYPKIQGIEHCIRNLGAKIIVCDELEEKDLKSVEKCASTGVVLIATVHGDFKYGVRKFIFDLLKTNAFGFVAQLETRENPSKVKKVWSKNEFIKNYRCNNICDFNNFGRGFESFKNEHQFKAVK